MSSDIPRLIYTTIMVSSSGALSPGPLTITTLALGSRYGWKGGVVVAIGHAIIELPYIILLYLSLSSIDVILKGFVGDMITVLGTLMVLFFAQVTIRDGLGALRSQQQSKFGISRGYMKIFRNPIVIGVVLTGLNIWFLLWWLSIGLGLISMVAGSGIGSVLIIFVSHIWIDFLWLAVIAEAGRRGTKVIRSKGYGIVMVFLGGVLALFGVNISLKKFLSLSLLP